MDAGDKRGAEINAHAVGLLMIEGGLQTLATGHRSGGWFGHVWLLRFGKGETNARHHGLARGCQASTRDAVMRRLSVSFEPNTR